MPLFGTSVAFAWRTAFGFIAANQGVTLRTLCWRPAAHARAVWMDIHRTVRPDSSPRMAGDKYAVRAPVKAGEAPSPGTEGDTDTDAETETDCATDDEPRTWRRENDQRIVGRDDQESRIHRVNCYIG